MNNEKDRVKEFWSNAACGEKLYLEALSREDYERQAKIRYELEPYIIEFAEFEKWRGKRVLEIGVGLGADHHRFAESGAELCGIDMTGRAVVHARRRLRQSDLVSALCVGDAEKLPFADSSFDLVYAWGVLHHTPKTARAFSEVARVLADGGQARIMIYQRHSLVGWMLWLRYGLLTGRPWRSLDDVYSNHLESPGTKAYDLDEVAELCQDFSQSSARTVLTHGDLLESEAGQRHRGPLLSLARRIWPRSILRRLFPNRGLFLLIAATK